jgi:hypothetical protein
MFFYLVTYVFWDYLMIFRFYQTLLSMRPETGFVQNPWAPIGEFPERYDTYVPGPWLPCVFSNLGNYTEDMSRAQPYLFFNPWYERWLGIIAFLLAAVGFWISLKTSPCSWHWYWFYIVSCFFQIVLNIVFLTIFIWQRGVNSTVLNNNNWYQVVWNTKWTCCNMPLGFIVFLWDIVIWFIFGIASFFVTGRLMYVIEKTEVSEAYMYDEDYKRYRGQYESKYKSVGY